MAGGLFPNYPFELNIKCIIFSLIIIGLFFYKPPEMNNYYKLLLSLFLFIISYVSMAWYDYKFKCELLPLRRGSKSITGYLKPNIYNIKQITKDKDNEDEKLFEKQMINLFHILILSPLLMYIGYNKINLDDINNSSIILLLVIITFAFTYHITRYNDKNNNNKKINLYHLITILLLLYYILYDKNNTIYFKSLLISSVLVILIHGYKLMVNIHKINDNK